jgi:hypothetical protein
MSLTDFSEPQPSLAWTFDGTTAPYTGSLSATNISGTNSYTSGKSNQAISFFNPSASVSNSITYTLTSTINMDSGFTMAVWVKFSNSPGGGGTDACAVEIPTVGAVNGGRLRFVGGSSTLAYNSTFYSVGGSMPAYDTWVHYTATILNGIHTFYTNGVLTGTASYPTNGTMGTDGVYAGRSTYFGMDGLIDDLRIYQSALTAAQVRSIYTQSGAPASNFRVMPQPRLAWDFNGTTTDYVSGLTPSFVWGNPTSYGTGKYLQDAVFNTTPGSATSGLRYDVSGQGLSSFTIAFWVKPLSTIPVASGNQRFLHFIDTNSTNFFWMGFQATVTTPTIYGQNPSGGSPLQTIGFSVTPPTMTQGQWLHLTWTVSQNGQYSVYVNGVSYAVNPTTLYASQGVSGNPFSLANPLKFIDVATQGGGQAAFCEIDDLRIYNTALTAAQIQSIYNQQGMPGRAVASNDTYITSGLVAYYDTQNLSYPNSVSGTTWYDISGNGRSVTIRPGSSYNSPGKYITFDGTVNSGTTVAQSGQSLTRWTVMCAFMQTANGTGFARIAGSSPSFDAGEIGLNGQTLAFNSPESASWTYTSFTTTYNVWYHMCVAFDTTTTGVVDAWVYINGALVNSYTIDGSVESLTGYTIGARSDFNNEGMIGRMSLFAIYNRVLSPSEVSANYEFYKKTQIPTYLPVQLTGAPLFNQLSQSATSSAVGAFSLRAVNGVSTRAVNVVAGGAFPITGFSTSATQSTNQFTQTLTGYPFTGSYVANCSTFYSGSGTEQPWRCFDKNNNGTWWTTSGAPYSTSTGLYTAGVYSTTISGSAYAGEWIQIKLPVSITLLSYTIYNAGSGSGFNSRAPVDFKIAGSNDGITWTLVDTQTAITSWLSSTTNLTFTPSNPGTYSYYRLCVNKRGTGDGYLSIGELVLNGTVPSLAQDFYADERGNLLTAPVTGIHLKNWLGGATGYVTKWYDQSGRGNDAIQNTAANQPIIQRATKGPGYMCLYSGTQGLNFGAYDLLNNKNYTTCGVVRRTAVPAVTNYYLCGDGGVNNTDQKFHSGYRTSTLLTLAHYADDANLTVPSFLTSSTEPTAYNYLMLGTGLSGRMYSYSSGTLYSATKTYTGYLNHTVGTSFSIGGGFGTFIGEIYEILVFTRSLYDLDGTSTITQIYQNQLGAYGT